MKKIFIIGVIALVVVGCILAAGCTSTTEIPSADDQIIGTWMNNNGTTKFVINGNLTGAYYKLDNGEWKEDASILWTKNKDGTYYLINGNAKATITLDPVKSMFTTDSGTTFTKQISENSGELIWCDF